MDNVHLVRSEWKPEVTHYACKFCDTYIAFPDRRVDRGKGLSSWIKFDQIANLKVDNDSLVTIPMSDSTMADAYCIACSKYLGRKLNTVYKGVVWHIKNDNLRLVDGKIITPVPESVQTYYECNQCGTYIAMGRNLIRYSQVFHGTAGAIFNRVENVSMDRSFRHVKKRGLDIIADVYCVRCHQLLGYKYLSTVANLRTVLDGQELLYVNLLKHIDLRD